MDKMKKQIFTFCIELNCTLLSIIPPFDKYFLSLYVGTNIYRFSCDSFDTYRTYRIKPKLVEQYDINGNFIRVYESVNQAAKDNGICSPQIADVCSHRHGVTAGGFRWKYVEEKEMLKPIGPRSIVAYENNEKKRSSA